MHQMLQFASYHGQQRREAELERGRTKRGKVKADAAADVEARYKGDGATCGEDIIRHSN